MDINTDKMIEQQDKLNEHIANTIPERDIKETVCYVEKTMPTKSHLVVHGGYVMVTRYMYNSIYRVSFDIDVLAKSVVDYMDMDDKTFIQVSDR